MHRPSIKKSLVYLSTHLNHNGFGVSRQKKSNEIFNHEFKTVFTCKRRLSVDVFSNFYNVYLGCKQSQLFFNNNYHWNSSWNS